MSAAAGAHATDLPASLVDVVMERPAWLGHRLCQLWTMTVSAPDGWLERTDDETMARRLGTTPNAWRRMLATCGSHLVIESRRLTFKALVYRRRRRAVARCERRIGAFATSVRNVFLRDAPVPGPGETFEGACRRQHRGLLLRIGQEEEARLDYEAEAGRSYGRELVGTIARRTRRLLGLRRDVGSLLLAVAERFGRPDVIAWIEKGTLEDLRRRQAEGGVREADIKRALADARLRQWQGLPPVRSLGEPRRRTAPRPSRERSLAEHLTDLFGEQLLAPRGPRAPP